MSDQIMPMTAVADRQIVNLIRALASEWIRDLEARGPVTMDNRAAVYRRVELVLKGFDEERGRQLDWLMQEMVETRNLAIRPILMPREEKP